MSHVIVNGAGVGLGCLTTSRTVAKYEVLIKAVTVQHLSFGQVAVRYGVSKTLVHKLYHRWLTEGEDAYQPRSRRPHHNPGATPPAVRERVLALRTDLLDRGLDAGADTLCWHLANEQKIGR